MNESQIKLPEFLEALKAYADQLPRLQSVFVNQLKGRGGDMKAGEISDAAEQLLAIIRRATPGEAMEAQKPKGHKVCTECGGAGLTDNHVTGEVECGTCQGTGRDCACSCETEAEQALEWMEAYWRDNLGKGDEEFTFGDFEGEIEDMREKLHLLAPPLPESQWKAWPPAEQAEWESLDEDEDYLVRLADGTISGGYYDPGQPGDPENPDEPASMNSHTSAHHKVTHYMEQHHAVALLGLPSADEQGEIVREDKK